jgi:hypothetical protein
VRPDLRGDDFKREVLEYPDDRTVELMRWHNIASDCLYADTFRGDIARVELLTALGWEPDDELPYVLNRTEINSIAVLTLPDGFSFQSAKGVEDAATLTDVYNASFGANWTPALYRQVMESPGYEPERELVIHAPDGSFAAFSVIWYDQLNRTGLFETGLFEPVGMHKDYRQRGFGRAIVLYGM